MQKVEAQSRIAESNRFIWKWLDVLNQHGESKHMITGPKLGESFPVLGLFKIDIKSYLCIIPIYF